jgi:hypothetical protein
MDADEREELRREIAENRDLLETMKRDIRKEEGEKRKEAAEAMKATAKALELKIEEQVRLL